MRKKPKTKYKVILFDKDGVLLDSIDTCLTAFNETLQHFGKSILSKERYLKEFWGTKAEVNIAKIFKNLLKNEVKEVVDYYMKKREDLEEYTRLYPDIIPVLETLKGNYKLGVITNTLRNMAIKLLQNFDILKYFDIIIGGDEGKPKPSKALILKACNLLKVQPKECLFIGDTITDIKAGKAAGCTTLIITTSISREQLRNIRNIIIIDNLKDIIEIV